MDKLEKKLESICYDQKEETDRSVGSAIFGLKTEILREVDQEVEVLETTLEAKNEQARQTTAMHLQEIKNLVVAV